MKRMKFLNGIGAMFALAVVALATTLTSCEKEEFNINVDPINAQATISPTVLYVDGTTTTNVTDQAAITYSDGPVFVGNPGIEAKTVTVTAKYNNLEGSNTVNVPALQAGQFLTLTTTIVLQAEPEPGEPVVTIVNEAKEEDAKDIAGDVVEIPNVTDYYYEESVSYTFKSGSKVVEKTFAEDCTFEEKALVGGFINTLDETYTEEQRSKEVTIYAHSMTKVNAVYTIVPTVYTFKRVTTVEGEVTEEVQIATVTVDDYTSFNLKIEDNQQIPGHDHAPAGHGHGHGHGSGNAGGGIVIPD
ncbi:DUF3869 domain-containing protein [Bacteroides ndongoniae]|jgi:hypothetical protein|uniref:DUF3869 domain-containing protein n=2 Tax=Bacteroides TaxID=816 RepID=UPI0023FA1182|nr:DUF3869 domain-containing protein [Bacteroides ndongoniae]